ncbi:epidermal differentiation-specific protein-like [Heterodontus francisci]|uniref:epidermal differentiation-specific protein-like n=1 Tax=Heterodontus francisci TaxID=7792 RepID=UPI00355B399E
MSKIILYDQENLHGDGKVFTDSVLDLEKEVFSDKARSLKVEGKHWVAYTCTNYTGQFIVYGAGDHLNLENLDRKIQSLRLVKEDLQDPEIKLFEHINYGGKERDITGAADDLKDAGFNNLVSSHHVKRGVWVLYENKYYNGNRLITFLGDQWVNYRNKGCNDKLSSLKPLLSTDFKV